MYYQITPKESKKYFKFTQLSPMAISQIRFFVSLLIIQLVFFVLQERYAAMQ